VIECFLGKLTTKLIAVGRAEAAIAVKLGIVSRERCVTIENGISETDAVSSVYTREQRTILRKSMNIPANCHVVASICRLVGYKGVFRFLEAARQSHTPDTLFVIAGDGQLMTLALRYIHDHHLTDKVRLLGYTDSVDQIYTIADLIVLCSDAEACPYVILEAMRARRPIVATSVVGIREHIRHNRTGLLVRPSAKALAGAIDELLTNKTKCHTLSLAAYEHFKTNHLLERQVNNLSRLYQTSA
jgi:starch synthase (maltosyl-transferring)